METGVSIKVSVRKYQDKEIYGYFKVNVDDDDII